MTFDEFEETAAELFGIEPGGEARDFAELVESLGFDLDEVDVRDKDFWEIAFEATDEFIEPYMEEVPERWPLDRYFPDDDYLDPGVEWEVTISYNED